MSRTLFNNFKSHSVLPNTGISGDINFNTKNPNETGRINDSSLVRSGALNQSRLQNKKLDRFNQDSSNCILDDDGIPKKGLLRLKPPKFSNILLNSNSVQSSARGLQIRTNAFNDKNIEFEETSDKGYNSVCIDDEPQVVASN